MNEHSAAQYTPSETTPLLRAKTLISDRYSACNNTHDAEIEVNDQSKPDEEISLASEFKLISRYSSPLIVTYLLQYSYNVILVFVVSHLGTQELASVSLGITTMNIIGYSVFEGLATSLDTLCSQAYGSGNYKLVGIYVQKMLLLLLQVSVPIVFIWVFSPYIFVLMVRQHDVALLAGTFLRFSAIGVPGYAVFEVEKRFLQAQGDFQGGLVALVCSMPVLVFLNWLLVYVCYTVHRFYSLRIADEYRNYISAS